MRAFKFDIMCSFFTGFGLTALIMTTGTLPLVG